MFGAGGGGGSGNAAEVPSGPNKANSEAAKKHLENMKSESDGTTRKKKIRERERPNLSLRLRETRVLVAGFTQPLEDGCPSMLTLEITPASAI